MGSLSLLQQIFLTQESNWGLLHCRWILYQLSYHRSPQNGEHGILYLGQNTGVGSLSLGQNTGVGSLSLLQGIFPTQGSNQVSHIAGGFFTS